VTDQHPFRVAFETRDLDGWVDALAPDVVVHSPIVRSSFIGREAAAELYGVLLKVLGRFEVTHEFQADDAHAFYWRVDIGGRWVQGTDLLRHDEHGKIAEITVLIRPLTDIAVFAGAVGPPLARHRGRLRALLLQLLTMPLQGMLALADVVAARVVQPRGSR
jgi:hypothetical protein